MKTFKIRMTMETTFTVDELWPDDDAPDDPTVNDVIDLLDVEEYPSSVIANWNLEDVVTTVVSDDRQARFWER